MVVLKLHRTIQATLCSHSTLGTYLSLYSSSTSYLASVPRAPRVECLVGRVRYFMFHK